MKYSFVIFGILLIGSVFGCESTQKIDKEALAASKRSQEIKRLSQADITEAAFMLGRAQMNSAKRSFQILRDSICDLDVENLKKYCQEKGLLEKDSVYYTRNCVINRYSVNSKGLTNIEQQLMEAYQYNSQNALLMTDNVQKLDKAYLFTQPILAEEMGCINCFDLPADSIDSKELVGMWSITIPSKELILGM